MARRALIVHGGWEGHEPDKVAGVFAASLREHGFDVEVSPTLDSFLDVHRLEGLSLIVPVWTMGEISDEQTAGLAGAVAAGVGLAGCHGGMCDSFRGATTYHLMTGGQFVAHPGDEVEYAVAVVDKDHYVTRGLSDFSIRSEQYYMHVDPSNVVLATTRFPVAPGPHAANGAFDMPVAWVRRHGDGRVFYCSLGHNAQVFDHQEVLELCTRGLLWAARADDG
jgi:type 1 glutamine amidotransferase